MTGANDILPTRFEVRVAFGGERVVLAVVGEVDIVTAPEFGAVLDAVIARGHRDVVLDLAGLEFMGAAGLRVVAGGAVRLRTSGAKLTVRSASAMVVRILEITGLAGVVSFEQPRPARDRLAQQRLGSGAEQSEGGPAPAHDRMAGLAGLAGQLRRASAIAAGTDVVDAALRLVVALARATVGGADGVSVSLLRHGRLSTVAASDQTIIDMDIDQYATGEGPCVDASRQGRWFHAESLDQEARWPAFTPRARDLGINAILSTPLMVTDRPVGALNMYSRTAAAFSASQQELASVFAAQASSVLTDAGVDVTDDQLSGQISEALRTRQIIVQAQGAIMEREGICEQDAYIVLRTFSQRADQPLAVVAAEIVASTRRSRLPERAREAAPDD